MAAAPMSALAERPASDPRAPRARAATAGGEVAEVDLTWLEGRPAGPAASTWGTPWPKGEVAGDQTFRLTAADGAPVPVQSWPLAYWPDGTLKWSGHAVAVDTPADSYALT